MRRLKRKKISYLAVCALFCVAVCVAADKKREGQTVITSDKLDFNYRSNVAVFEGNVVVKDPEITMTSDKMTASFDKEGNIRVATARGNVKAWYQDKTASSSLMIYQAEKSEVEMRGDCILTRATDIVKGDRIVFWLNEERMVVEPAFLTITSGEDPVSAVKQGE